MLWKLIDKNRNGESFDKRWYTAILYISGLKSDWLFGRLVALPIVACVANARHESYLYWLHEYDHRTSTSIRSSPVHYHVCERFIFTFLYNIFGFMGTTFFVQVEICSLNAAAQQFQFDSVGSKTHVSASSSLGKYHQLKFHPHIRELADTKQYIVHFLSFFIVFSFRL